VKRVAELLNEMRKVGVISNYALFGATAQMRYTEAVATLDADVLVAVPPSERLDILAPIYAFCTAKGYRTEGEAVRVGAWPVQFIPAFSPLAEAAIQRAETADYEGTPFRVVRADDLALLALSTGRAKDFARILALLESASVSREGMVVLARPHGLEEAWSRFERRFLNE
jgi:hypothetical protein